MVTIGFDSATYSVTEGAGSVDVTVAVQGSLGRNVVVTLSTVDGTATGGCSYYYTLVTVVYHSTPLFLSPAPGDYTAITNMQLTFNASMMSQTVMITIADGAVVEGPETFSVTLETSDTAVMLDPMTAAVNIREDNDSKLYSEQVCVSLLYLLHNSPPLQWLQLDSTQQRTP